MRIKMTNKANMVKALLIFCLFFVFLANANAQKYLVNGSGLEMFYYNNSTKKYDKSAGTQKASIVYNINVNEMWIKMTTSQTDTKKSIISEVVKNNGIYEFIILSRFGDNDRMKITYNINTNQLYQYMDYNSYTKLYMTKFVLLNPVGKKY